MNETECAGHMERELHSRMPVVPVIRIRKGNSTSFENVHFFAHPDEKHKTCELSVAILTQAILAQAISTRNVDEEALPAVAG